MADPKPPYQKAVITYSENGQMGSYQVDCLRTDTEETLTARARRWFPGQQVIKVEFKG